MRKQHHTDGYIMVFALIIIGLMVYLTTYILTKKLVYTSSVNYAVEKEKAHMLALGGIQIAIGQLSKIPQATGSKNDDKQKDYALTLLKTILPALGRFQNFTFKKELEGLDGTLQICIMSEDGKIDINALYDFENHTFFDQKTAQNPQANTFIPMLFEKVEQRMGGKNLYKGLEKFLKERKTQLHDITELLKIKELEIFVNAVWYDPQRGSNTGLDNDKKAQPFYLTDIFTLWSHKKTIEPWLISDSLCALLDLTTMKDRVVDQERIAQLLKNFTLQSTWATDWNKQLAPWYGKSFNALPVGFTPYLSTNFTPSIFSVLSYGKVGRITEKLLAIVERSIVIEQEKVEIKNTIKKLYQL